MSKRLLIDARQIEETRVITTTNDVLGLSIYFAIANALL